MTIGRLDGLGDIANLRLTLTEAQRLLVQIQQQVVAAPSDIRGMFRLDYRWCGRTCHVKDWHPHRIATLFGDVRLNLPDFCALAAVVAALVSVGHRIVDRPLS